MNRKPEDGPDLEDFLAAARAQSGGPPGALLARIEADALAAMPDPARRGSFWRALSGALGGWPAMAGLAAAACAGVWFGFAPPDAVATIWLEDAAFSALDPVSGYDFAMVGG